MTSDIKSGYMSDFKIPPKMTNEWIDYAENRHIRGPFKYAVTNSDSNLNNNISSKNNNIISNNNNNNSTNKNNNLQLHHQQSFQNKMGIKQFNYSSNNSSSSTLNQQSLLKQFHKPLKGEMIIGLSPIYYSNDP